MCRLREIRFVVPGSGDRVAALVQIGVWPVNPPQMIAVSAGSFTMGSVGDDARADETPAHAVVLAN